MVFAWQGFSLEHPEDWLPVNLTGNREEGYARISSPDEAFLQLRWKASKGQPTVEAVNAYLSRLQKDALRRKQPFEQKANLIDGKVDYSYRSEGWATGRLFRPSPEGRVFFVEVVGPTRSKLNNVLKGAIASFTDAAGESERWSLLGLDLLLPANLKLESQELKAGKTALNLRKPGLKIGVQRWGFAEQLLQKHPLPDWTRAVTGLKAPEVKETEGGVELTAIRPLRPTVTVLAKLQTRQNQITVIRVESRRETDKPQWSWFV